MEQPEKIRLSSDFIIIKLFIIALLGLLFLLLTDYKRTPNNRLIEYCVIFSVLALFLILLFLLPDYFYDDDKLYIKKLNKIDIVCPLVNIQSIYLSVFGIGKFSYSYRIKYLNDANEIKSVRIFLTIFDGSISNFITCAKKLNPDVKTRNWSVGINELFD